MPPVAGLDRTIAAIALAVLTFGISFGVLARAVGLDAAQTIAMSAIVFAGSAQFAAVAALDGGASALSAALAGIALNTRYLPLGIVAGRWLGGGPARRAFDAHLVIDEGVALATDEAARVDEPRFRTIGVTLLAAWLTGTSAGVLGGGLIGDPADLGLDAPSRPCSWRWSGHGLTASGARAGRRWPERCSPPPGWPCCRSVSGSSSRLPERPPPGMRAAGPTRRPSPTRTRRRDRDRLAADRRPRHDDLRAASSRPDDRRNTATPRLGRRPPCRT